MSMEGGVSGCECGRSGDGGGFGVLRVGVRGSLLMGLVLTSKE